MKDEHKSAEEYRKSADEHLAAIKSSIRTLMVVGVVMLLSAAMLVIFAFAWFASNKNTTAGEINVSLNDEGIELRSYGGIGDHDDVLKKILGENGEKGFWYSKGEDGKLDTSLEMPAVNWLLSDESNIGNYSNGEEIDWTKDTNKRIDHAIEPGAAGTIKFYVVPKVSGNITVKCNLSMIPYSVRDDVFTQISDDTYAPEELSGHILFFLQNNNSLWWIKDNEFELKIPNAVKGEEYLYTVYWSWPQIFGEIILKEGDAYLNGRKPIYDKYTNGAAIRNAIVEEMTTKPNRFFYSSLTKKPLDTNYAEVSFIDTIHTKTTDQLLLENNSKAIQAFVDLSSYYNQADQYIGKNVDCVRIALTAELKNVEK